MKTLPNTAFSRTLHEMAGFKADGKQMEAGVQGKRRLPKHFLLLHQ